MTNSIHTLEDVREKIDHIDRDILQLVEQRADVAKIVKQIKLSQSPSPQYYRPEREAQVLRNTLRNYQGNLDQQDIVHIFRAIMSACLALQQQQHIAFLGPLGTFSHQSALKHFGDSINTVPCTSIPEVLKAVNFNNAYYGVIPIENSTEGVINVTLDQLLTTNLTICGEVNLRVRQHLLRRHTNEQSIEKIYSHPQSLAQCRQWLQQHLPNVELCPVASNAKAAELAAQDGSTAAIAGKLAQQHYQLHCVHSNIEDNPQNTTRFLVLGKHPVGTSGVDRTSLLLTSPTTPNRLNRILTHLKNHQILMLHKRTCPHGSGACWYFIDIEGHIEDKSISDLLNQLTDANIAHRILGAYPATII